MSKPLEAENFVGDNVASDRLNDWVEDNVTEDDFREEEGNLYCRCEVKPETLGIYYLSDSAEQWEDWMEDEGGSESIFAVYFCYVCKCWFVDCDLY
ncbi:hypothetical protein ACQVPP_27815 [Bacillus luti]|uniref:hypothetical protein n=1 Tax=Bacillus luti TaxID=2026191 RepID=UPI003D657AAE